MPACLLRVFHVYKQGKDADERPTQIRGIAIVGRSARACTTTVRCANPSQHRQFPLPRRASVDRDKVSREVNRHRGFE